MARPHVAPAICAAERLRQCPVNPSYKGSDRAVTGWVAEAGD